MVRYVTSETFLNQFIESIRLNSQAEFKRRYGGIGAPAYLKMMDTIERRIAAMPLYR